MAFENYFDTHSVVVGCRDCGYSWQDYVNPTEFYAMRIGEEGCRACQSNRLTIHKETEDERLNREFLDACERMIRLSKAQIKGAQQ